MLVKCLRDAWRHVAIVGVDRKYWSEQAGFEFLTQLVFDDEERTPTIVAAKAKYVPTRRSCSRMLDRSSRYYALSATSALFKYLESAHQLTFASKSLHVRFATLEGNMLIDRDTALNLELVSNASHPPARLPVAVSTDAIHFVAAQQKLETSSSRSAQSLLYPHGHSIGRCIVLCIVPSADGGLQLRSNILSPLTNVEVIDARLDVVRLSYHTPSRD